MSNDVMMYDACDWPQRLDIAANGHLDGALMRHIAADGDALVRMALATRRDLPETIRVMLARDVNPWVRAVAHDGCVRLVCDDAAPADTLPSASAVQPAPALSAPPVRAQWSALAYYV